MPSYGFLLRTASRRLGLGSAAYPPIRTARAGTITTRVLSTTTTTATLMTRRVGSFVVSTLQQPSQTGYAVAYGCNHCKDCDDTGLHHFNNQMYLLRAFSTANNDDEDEDMDDTATTTTENMDDTLPLQTMEEETASTGFRSNRQMVQESLAELEGLVEQTQALLLQKQSTTIAKQQEGDDVDSDDHDNDEARELVETWLELCQEWHKLFLELESEDKDSRSSSDHNNRNQTDRSKLLQAMLQGSHALLDLLPRVEPKLAPYYEFQQTQQLQYAAMRRAASATLEDEEDSGKLLFSTDSDSPSLQPTLLDDKEELWELCGRVLQTCDHSMRAFHQYHEQQRRNKRMKRNQQRQQPQQPQDAVPDESVVSLPHLLRLSRELPQRSQFIYERLHHASSPVSATRSSSRDVNYDKSMEDSNNSPSGDIGAYGLSDKKKPSSSFSRLRQQVWLQDNAAHVLATWAYSQELQRGQRAQNFYQQYAAVSSSKGITVTAEDVLRLQLVLHAWVHSPDRQAAFEATKSLNQWLAWLQQEYKENSAEIMKRQLQQQNDAAAIHESLHDGDEGVADENKDPPPPIPRARTLSVLPEPSLQDYHLVMRSWTRNASSHSPTRAQKLLKAMKENVFDQGVTSVRPDVTMFEGVLQTAAKRPLTQWWALRLVLTDTWKLMKEHMTIHNSMVAPSYACYAHAIRGWKFVAKHPDTASKRDVQDMCVQTVLDLWNEAKELKRFQTQSNGGDDNNNNNDLGPSFPTETYNDMLEILSVWSADATKKIEQAEAILKEMEDSAKPCKDSLEDGPSSESDSPFRPPPPNARSYVLMIRVWQSITAVTGSARREALPQAKKILWQSLEHQRHHSQGYDQPLQNVQKRRLKTFANLHEFKEGTIVAESNSAGYPVDVLNAFVNLCAAQRATLTKEELRTEGDGGGLRFLKEALSAVDSYRRRGQVLPNWNTYTALLHATSRLLPQHVEEITSTEAGGNYREKVVNPKREQTIEHIFRLACQDGMVENELLEMLMRVTTEEQYQNLVLSHGVESIEDGPDHPVNLVPDEWSQQALGKDYAITFDGRKILPLTVFGKLLETKSMKEFKMRNLRNKRRQKLLRGGRWKEETSA